MLETARKTITGYNLIKKGDKIVIGVSGGPDSLALLYILNSLKKEFNLELQVAHLDHMLRKDSAGDREFVVKLCQKIKVPVTTAEINIKALSKKGSQEEIARNARLGFLFRVAREIKAKKIALGHNLDDQAETVLMRILRGSGLYGLSGILPKKNIAGFFLIRPLIQTKRSEIEAFLRRKRIRPRLDSSNLKDVYFRNKIRNRLLPFLEKGYNRNIKEVLSNMAESIGYDYDYLNYLVERRINPAKKKILLARLERMHIALRRLIFRKVISRLKGSTRRIGFRHIKEIEDLIFNRPVNSIVDLPKGISVIKQKKYLTFYLR
ncbi:MAG: tRNA lysidine(34) synthetase TilS [Candidatus Omnitrophota bacterium]|nr:MAG: tRNA lysidine(34) synthetase TilS [Candidatus Omnitrophota bacterium]